MRKDEWIRLAMPASISLLAISIFTIPFVVQAQLGSTGTVNDPIYVRIKN